MFISFHFEGLHSFLRCRPVSWQRENRVRLIAMTLLRAIAVFLIAGSLSASAASLQIVVSPKVSGENVQPNSLRYRTSAGESFSITRISGLLSEFALQRDDGSWLEISNSVAW